jgi:hypothetical protein
VNDVLGFQVVAFGDLGLSGLTSTQSSAFREELWAGRAMDRPINPPSSKQRTVGGIDDGIGILVGDISL